jgi:signal transduction histidine kinase
VEQGVYRVAQEALANVVNHALAHQISVQWIQNNGQLTLKIADDGCGFEPYRVDTGCHFGLKGMRERAEMIGAVLTVASKPGKGTTVYLTVNKYS